MSTGSEMRMCVTLSDVGCKNDLRKLRNENRGEPDTSRSLNNEYFGHLTFLSAFREKWIVIWGRIASPGRHILPLDTNRINAVAEHTHSEHSLCTLRTFIAASKIQCVLLESHLVSRQGIRNQKRKELGLNEGGGIGTMFARVSLEICSRWMSTSNSKIRPARKFSKAQRKITVFILPWQFNKRGLSSIKWQHGVHWLPAATLLCIQFRFGLVALSELLFFQR